jgi:ABC-type Fe3+ transport system permease subunit
MPHGPGPRLYLGMSLVPLLLAVVVPVPFGLASGGQNDWARQTAIAIARIGIALSVVLFAVGVVLTVRAIKAGDRRGAKLLAIETALAAMPAGLVTVVAAMFRFL